MFVIFVLPHSDPATLTSNVAADEDTRHLKIMLLLCRSNGSVAAKKKEEEKAACKTDGKYLYFSGDFSPLWLLGDPRSCSNTHSHLDKCTFIQTHRQAYFV